MSPLFLVLLAPAAFAAETSLDFQRDVRPILSNHCYQCHGPDEHGRKAGLRLDIREEALKPAKSGDLAIVPGKPADSHLVTRILTRDEDEIMPPPQAKKPITDAQREILKRWISEGAPYAPHWAYKMPVKAAVPQVSKLKLASAEWNESNNPIDGFIAQKLVSGGLKPSAKAAPEALIRRLYLDLTGLPPAADDVKAITPQSYEALVDKLLDSPQYGERWARRWLDLARYADTNGYEKDRERSIWPYRDWVIRALNADMPFNQFTIEQIAGDMLLEKRMKDEGGRRKDNPGFFGSDAQLSHFIPQTSIDLQTATGFHRNTMLNEEGGIDPLEFRFHAMTDRVATTSATWLGLTMQCTQCHTHKYDSITHTEYYGVMAFLNNADEPELDLPDEKAAGKASQNLQKAAAMLKELPGKWPNQKAGKTIDTAFSDWLKAGRQSALTWNTLKPVKAVTNMPLLTIQPDGAMLGSGDITKADTYQITLAPAAAAVRAIRLEVLPHESLPAHGPGMCYYEGPRGDFFMGEFKVSVNGKPLKISSATESYSKNNFGVNPTSAMLATDGDPQTGWSCAGHFGKRDEAVFVLAEAIPANASIRIEMMFGRHYACPLGHFRLSATDAPKAVAHDMDSDIAALLHKPDSALSTAEKQVLFESFMLSAPELAAQAKIIRNLRNPPALTHTLVMRERPTDNPRPTHRHHRGEFTQPKELVSPATLSVLHPFPKDAPKNRLGFALWLASPQNPLTPRVVVNRAWAAFFGQGIVKTVDDFGYQGSLPSHPELLDWLAADFVEKGWSMKKLHRLIVTSAAYQQSADHGSSDAQSIDPQNILLSHSPRVRLEAEIIRDSMLKAAGILNPQIGGPSVYPPQPESVTEAAYGRFQWKPSTGADRYRRSLYTFSKRTAPFALFTTFDGPTGEACLVKRETSNSALQALTTMNDIIVTEAAQALGKLIANHPGSDVEKLRLLYLRVLARQPDATELGLTSQFVEHQRTRLQKGELNATTITGSKTADDRQAAIWTLAARALFNLDEFITKN